MSPSQASSDDFPRLIGAENFDVWKARVCAALDGKHLLGFVKKPDYDGVSEEESEDDGSGSEVSDEEDPPKAKPAVEVDSDAVDYEDSSDEQKPASESDDESGDSDTTMKAKDLPAIRPFNRSNAKRASKHKTGKTKPQPLNPRERRRQEAKTKAFLMKTMDNTHVRLVKDLKTSYEIFQPICAKYEGAAFHGDPYYIQHFLMELKYEEGGDIDDFLLKLENAMNATSEATESVMTEGQKSIYLFHALPKSWKDDLRVWKGQRKYIPYGELKNNIERKVREIQAEERYTLSKGTPESQATKKERALVATPKLNSGDHSSPGVCAYCERPRHHIRQCRSLQKDLREGRVKAGTVLPANFMFRGGDSNRNHPYRNNNKNSSRERNNGNRGKKDRRDNRSDRGKTKGDSDNERKEYNQERRETGLIAVVATVNPAISLTAQATVSPEPTWTIDSGCTRHVTHESQWFSTISASDGSITVGGKNEIPIEGIGKVELEVIDSKDTKRTLTLHDVLYAPELKFSLLSVPAAVKHDFRFSFDRKLCAVQTDAKFKIKAMMATHADLYQFQAKPVMKHEALIAHSGAKPSAG